MYSSLVTLLMSFSVVTGVIDNPPEDLLSLGETEKVLSQLGINQNEDALIALLGGKTTVKFDSTKLEAAVKMLREGKSKERREAKKILNAAGAQALDFFKKLQKDSDPEVSETAKMIVLRSKVAKKKAQQARLTEETIKLLAIRRLAELKSTRALTALKALASNKDGDLVREAKRALSILEGTKPLRTKRQVATLQALKMLPKGTGFAAVLDMAEPKKALKVKDYFAKIVKMNLPDMNVSMIVEPFHKYLPKILSTVGNPQVDAVAMAVSDELGAERRSGWIGFIFKGQYNVEKIKKALALEFDKKEIDGHTYYGDRWSSFYPVDKTTLIMSFGPRDAEPMAPFIAALKNKSIPEKFSYLNDTSTKRLLAMGSFSKKQSEVFLAEIKQEMKWAADRNGPNGQAQRAILDVGMILSKTKDFQAFYEKNVVTITGSLDDEATAEKLVSSLKKADESMRQMFKEIPIPAIVQMLDTKKAFSKSSSKGKVVTLRVKADLVNLMGIMPYMMMRDMGRHMHDHEIHVQHEGFEDVILEEPPEVEVLEKDE